MNESSTPVHNARRVKSSTMDPDIWYLIVYVIISAILTIAIALPLFFLVYLPSDKAVSVGIASCLTIVMPFLTFLLFLLAYKSIYKRLSVI